MSTNKFNCSRQKSDNIFHMCSVASMFVPQNKYFTSTLKDGECRFAQEGEEAEALLSCRLAVGRQRFSSLDSQLLRDLNSFIKNCYYI